MNLARRLLSHRLGSTSTEFALVLPLALLLLFGIIDVGRYTWEMNKLEKAVQLGTRTAVVTQIVPQGLNTEDYVGTTCGSAALVAGDTICKEALGRISCSKAGGSVSCSCATSPCPADLSDVNVAAFDKIVQRMRVIDKSINPSNVTISYSGSGIGYAGDPAVDDDDNDLSDIAPIVTVAVGQVTMRAMMLFGGGVELPGFNYSQTLEDGVGQVSY